MNILLVCSAGMSTSMLVTRMLDSANTKGIDVRIEAHPVAEVEMYGLEADAILLGPQVRFQLNNVKKFFQIKLYKLLTHMIME